VKLVLIGLLALSTAGAANLLVNGDFENEPNFGSGFANDAGFSAFTGTQIPGWIIDACCGATIHNNVLYPHISGTYSLNTDGEGHNGHNANLYQDFSTVFGTSYQLAYDWQGWQNNSATARLDISITDTVTSALLYDGNFSFNAALQHITTNFVGTGNALRLRIQESPESGLNDNQFMVDNLSVDSLAPEPSTWALSAMVLVLAGWRSRSRARS
jgi:hypothetical protein